MTLSPLYPEGGEPQRSKSCSRCKEIKPLSDYHRMTSAKDGRQHACKSCQSAAQATPEEAEKRREYAWDKCLEKKGMTRAQYDAMFEAQLGLCAVCHRPERGSMYGRTIRLSIDHDHSCCPDEWACGNCIRGLLCGSCNRGIGLLGEDSNIVLNALLYLRAKIG